MGLLPLFVNKKISHEQTTTINWFDFYYSAQ